MCREPVVWSCRDEERMHCATLDEAVEYYLDDLYKQNQDAEKIFRELGEITVTGYAREQLNRDILANDVLENTLERLDETYANPDSGGDLATPGMKAAAAVFADAIVADYVPWICEPVCKEKVNVLEWVRLNVAHWLHASG